MPIITSEYNPPFIFKNGHFSTIYSGLVRTVSGVTQERERITLPDGDFLDLDWSYAKKPSRKVLILIHGLEGNAQRPYITGSAKLANAHGYDVCAINLRGCSGVANTLYRSYHSGATEDLDAVLQHILTLDQYDGLYLMGFSLGGNLSLKFIGEERDLPKALKAVVAVSAPCDLYSSLKQLLLPINYLYALRFKEHLVAKLRIKQQLFPSKISDSDIANIKTLKDFDDIYTSAAHGFEDAMDYYKKCSCLQFLPKIKVPALIINAANDSFLGKACYPHKEAEENESVFLEVPVSGGHVGFYGRRNTTYTEKRALKFFGEI
ncbi:YheT family hydrolase [Maribacter polysaccharolyticus]|uniref:YheT family hydrolase n=1 Tax=Maribacter polysaccharolyticus TaxID=3020831 RepID=UPI00237F1827|nr:alpha/beta fold hydrolase [Maribacter polysaccharolyticus]MDE3743131.1 alpha/beta fold hydrolase [Maribacter polysaccharolyticus]